MGSLYPPKSENIKDEIVVTPKFTSFFKQISFTFTNENQPFIVVYIIHKIVEKTY